MEESSSLKIENNFVQDNGHGLGLESIEECLIAGNEIRDNHSPGIEIIESNGLDMINENLVQPSLFILVLLQNRGKNLI